MPRVIAFQADENEGKRSGVAEVVSRISTDSDGMSELIDTIAKAPGGETLVLMPIQS
jgi:hypothetical protein